MKRAIILLTIVFSLALFASPTPALADSCNLGPILPSCACGGNCFLSDFIILAINIAQYLLTLLFAVAVFMVFEAGFTFMTSGGSSENVQKAKSWLSGAIFGTLIVLLAWLLVGTIVFFMTGGSKLFPEGRVTTGESPGEDFQPATVINWWQIEAPDGCFPLDQNPDGTTRYECMDVRDVDPDITNDPTKNKWTNSNKGGWTEDEFSKFCFSNGKCTSDPVDQDYRCCSNDDRRKGRANNDPRGQYPPF